MKPHLSVIIPVFNEAGRIEPTLRKVDAYLSARSYAYEIIVVDDGSRDATVERVNHLRVRNLHVLSLSRNSGKGSAVKMGMLAASGETRLFMDADSSTDISEVEKLHPYLQRGYDIVIGSRRMQGATIAISQSLIRELLGAAYRSLSRILIPNEYADTQNGFKLFTETAARTVFTDLQTSGWSFDIEALLLAKKGGLRILEVPVIWSNDNQSRMTIAGMLRMAIDLWKIRSRLGKKVRHK